MEMDMETDKDKDTDMELETFAKHLFHSPPSTLWIANDMSLRNFQQHHILVESLPDENNDEKIFNIYTTFQTMCYRHWKYQYLVLKKLLV